MTMSSALQTRHGRACPSHPRLANYPMMAGGFVYILTNRPNGTLYVGVTNDLVRRIYEHRCGFVDGFTKRHGLNRLVYFEQFDDIRTAIQREPNIKHWPRAWKVRKILADDPDWHDLYSIIIS